jgi:hypothetical protein
MPKRELREPGYLDEIVVNWKIKCKSDERFTIFITKAGAEDSEEARKNE